MNTVIDKIIFKMETLIEINNPIETDKYLSNLEKNEELNNILEEVTPDKTAIYYKLLYNLKNQLINIDDNHRHKDTIKRNLSWTATTREGTDFSSHKFVSQDSNSLVFKRSLYYMLLSFIPLSMAIGLTIYNLSSEGSKMIWFIAGMGYFGFYCFFYGSFEKMVFDKEFGYYYVSTKRVVKRKAVKNLFYALLSDIHALQIIKKDITSVDSKGTRSRYKGSELNLVLKTGKRVNVFNHANHDEITENAYKISKFLNVPVWDYLDR